jgi:hypothetical protein
MIKKTCGFGSGSVKKTYCSSGSAPILCLLLCKTQKMIFFDAAQAPAME